MSSNMDEQFQRAIRAAQDAQEQARDASAGLREDIVETSVQFWTDPRMSDKTVQSKEQFLEQKGLTRRRPEHIARIGTVSGRLLVRIKLQLCRRVGILALEDIASVRPDVVMWVGVRVLLFVC